MEKAIENRKVTIITPTYRRLSSLKEAVQCVFNQTYANWEYIIIADGHDPKVEEYIRSLKDNRIRYLWTEKTNFFGNFQRNHGFKYATGEFVLFFDDDNLIYPDYLSEMLSKFNSKKIGYVICQIENHETGTLKPSLPFRMQEIDTLNFLIRRDLIEKVGGWPLERYEADFDLINKINKISECNFINKVLGEHRRLKKDMILHYILGKFDFLRRPKN
jgi:glycosyltransferase involved in cell wall biosynthesis